MKPHPDLFSDAPASAKSAKRAPDAPVPVGALKIAVNAHSAPLSPAQKRFNTLLTKVETLTTKIETARAAMDAHRPRHVHELAELEARKKELLLQMTLRLDERLRAKGLTAAQKRTATEIVISISESLAAEGDADMQALHDRHSPEDLDEKKDAATQEMKDMMEAMLGKPIAHDGDPDDMESLLHAAMREMMENAQAANDQREAAKAKRRAKKGLNAKEKLAQEEQIDAQSALRTLFRQLASALHPDRETNPDERARKTALMSEVNAAYQRRDLTALLQLQLKVELASPQAIAGMAEKKVAALSLLLKEQVAALEQDLAQLRQRAHGEFGLSHFVSVVNAANLARTLAEQRRALADDIAGMQQDLRRIADDAELKRWLKEQKELMQEQQFFDQFDPFADIDRTFGAMRRR